MARGKKSVAKKSQSSGTSKEDLGKQVDAVATAAQGPEDLVGEPSKDIRGDLEDLLKNQDAGSDATRSRLHHVLLSWKKMGQQTAPRQIIYLLSAHYGNKKLASFNMNDAKTVKFLNEVGQVYGFHVGLAQAQYYEEGYGVSTGYGGYGGYGGRGYGSRRYGCAGTGGWGRWGGRARYGCYGGYGFDDSSEGEEEDEYNDDIDIDEDLYGYGHGGEDVEMEEVHETILTVRALRDLDGKSLNTEALDFDASSDAIPKDMAKALSSQPHDEQKYSARGCRTLKRYYRRTAVVIWPGRHHYNVLYGKLGFTMACSELGKLTSNTPTEQQKELVEIILADATPDKSFQIVHKVCSVARLWGDAGLWLRAVNACDGERGISELQQENALDAIAVFGLDTVKTCLERALERDPSSVAVLRFLTSYEETVKGRDKAALATRKWINDSRKRTLTALKKPGHDRSSAEVIVSSAIKAGGAKVVQNVLDQLRAFSDPSVLAAFAEQVHDAPKLGAKDKTRLVQDSLSCAVSQVVFFDVEPEVAIDFATSLIRACVQLSHEELVPDLVGQLINVEGLDVIVAGERSRNILLPVVAALARLEISTEEAIAALHSLCEQAIQLYLQWASSAPKELSKANFSTLLQAAAQSEKPRGALVSIVDKLGGLEGVEDTVFLKLLEAFDAQRSLFEAERDTVTSSISCIATKYASAVAVGLYKRSLFEDPMFQFGALLPHYQVMGIRGAIERCIRYDAPEACTILLQRLCEKNSDNKDELANVLAIAVPDIAEHLKKYSRPLTSNYAAVYRTIFVYWVDKLMGPRPTTPNLYTRLVDQARRWTCSCEHCAGVREFITGSDLRSSLTLDRMGGHHRRHVESTLSSYTHLGVGYSTIHTKPQGMKVTRSNALMEPVRWPMYQETGAKFIEEAGITPEELRAILGGDHARILSALGRAQLSRNAPSARPAQHTTVSGVRAPVPAAATATLASATTARTAGQKRPAESSSVAIATSAGPSTGGASRQAKRRKTDYNAMEVIDLT